MLAKIEVERWGMAKLHLPLIHSCSDPFNVDEHLNHQGCLKRLSIPVTSYTTNTDWTLLLRLKEFIQIKKIIMQILLHWEKESKPTYNMNQLSKVKLYIVSLKALNHWFAGLFFFFFLIAQLSWFVRHPEESKYTQVTNLFTKTAPSFWDLTCCDK